MMKWQKKSLDERGAVTVELALLVTFLTVLGLGLLDVGLIFNRQMGLNNAARAGMQYAIVRRPINGDFSQIEAATLAAVPPSVGGSQPSVNTGMVCLCADGASNPCVSTEAGDNGFCPDGSLRSAFVEITITEDYPLLFNIPGMGESVELSKTVVARLN